MHRHPDTTEEKGTEPLPNPKLIDRYNRHLNYLRISITDRCNLQCIYCSAKDLNPRLRHDEILTYEEILRIVEIGVSLGISKVRVTGGEPLVRKGVCDFLEQLLRIEGLTDVSLTTNGILLEEHIDPLKSIGIHRINISLDTLNPEKFKKITGFDHFRRVWRGIQKAWEAGFDPIKLNIVALKGINDDEIIDFARLTDAYPFHVRFIEYMPVGNPQLAGNPFLLTPEIKTRIKTVGQLIAVENNLHDGPAKRYRLEGARGEIGFISALSHHFCEKCNRLRLTASGHLRPCLLSDHQEDLIHPVRNGCSDKAVADIFLKAIRQKPSDHHLAAHSTGKIKSQMNTIGG